MRHAIQFPVLGLFAGPAPASGFHFMTYSGRLNNEFTGLTYNHNLLKKIERVQSCSMAADADIIDIFQLGTRGTVRRANINSPTIGLNFDYYLNGIKNDLRIGLNINYAKFYYPFSGEPYYSGHVCPISGLVSRNLRRDLVDPFFPFDCREPRNLFLVIGYEGRNLTENEFTENFSGADLLQQIDPNSTGFQVVSFGNCYLTSYSTNASVGSIPMASTSWVCENVAFNLSGSGVRIPAIDTQSRQQLSGNKFVIPGTIREGGPTVLLPGDIVLDFAVSGDTIIPNLGVNFNNLTINSYSIGMSFDREPLPTLGHKSAVDRQINFPVYATLDFNITIADYQSGSILELLNKDSGYNITIRVKNPDQCSPFRLPRTEPNPHQDGPALYEGVDAIRYDFVNAKFNGLNIENAIGGLSNVNLSFTQEIDPDNLTRGLFISGLINVEKIEDFILYETTGSADKFFLLNEDSSPLVNNLSLQYT